jgi:hypothetical protein
LEGDKWFLAEKLMERIEEEGQLRRRGRKVEASSSTS